VRSNAAWFYFSLNGRVDRRDYWTLLIAPLIVVAILLGMLSRLMGLSTHAVNYTCLILLPVVAWISMAVSAKRWHDIGSSGWWAILSLVPFIGYVVVIALGVLPGEVGANRYGANVVRPTRT